MRVTRTSILSGRAHTREVDVTAEQLRRINTPSRSELLHHIVPHLSAEDAEFLRSGITPEEWAEMGWDEEDEA